MLSYVIKSSSFAALGNKRENERQETSEFISNRARSVLSRAAKRNVCQQQELLSQVRPWVTKTPRENLRSNKRKRQPGRRSLTSSAPPTVRQPPKIVVEDVSSRKSGVHVSVVDVRLPPEGIQCSSAPPSTTSDAFLSNIQWPMEESSSYQKTNYNPEYPFHLTRPKYQSSPKQLETNSRPATTDWDWVRSRLQSRDSVRRPESSMTFDDFLNGLDPDSDEYDTDLEDIYQTIDEDPYDHTGSWQYKKLCRIKRVAPAQQVLKKLAGKEAQFKLKHRYISSKDTEAIATGLKHNRFVEDVDLSGNFIDDRGIKHVADMMRNNVRIHRLDLSSNCLRQDAGRYLAEMMLDNNRLTQLCLRKNKLGDREALLLAEVMCNNHSLKSLDVSHNHFGDSAGEAFAAALMENKCLTSLDLSWNTLCRRAAAALARALTINENLLSIDLSWNGIGDEGAALLGNSLRENSTLRFLSVAVNHICGYGAEQLASGVTGTSIMSSLKGRKGMKKGGGKSNCGLEYLNLDRNPLGTKGVMILLQNFNKSPKMKLLSIKEVVLNENAMNEVRVQVKTAPKGKTLLYEGQDQLEQNEVLIKRGLSVLNEALASQNTKITEVIKMMDERGYGINVTDLRNLLSDYTHLLTELELEDAVRCLDIDNDDIVHYKDIAYYARIAT